ncbi:MAG: hypothetical protein ACRDTM_11170 [Micromonosporaceae bacterium]
MTAALLGITGCGGEEPEAKPSPSATSAEASPTPSPTPSATAAAPTVSVEIKGGKVVSGSGRHKIKLGSKVVLEFVSDTADEVHVHGYDKEVALRPGTPARVEFTANIPGVFEVELHESGLALCELQVQ